MTRKQLLSVVLLSLFLPLAGVTTVIITAAPLPTAIGQVTPQGTFFTDDTGFIAYLEPGWITNDYDNRGPEALAAEEQLGYTKLVTYCPETDALPSLGSDVPTCTVEHL